MLYRLEEPIYFYLFTINSNTCCNFSSGVVVEKKDSEKIRFFRFIDKISAQLLRV